MTQALVLQLLMMLVLGTQIYNLDFVGNRVMLLKIDCRNRIYIFCTETLGNREFLFDEKSTIEVGRVVGICDPEYC